MNIENYCFSFKRINPIILECFVKNNDNVSFGIVIKSQVEPPKEWVFEIFKNNFKQFFIEGEQEDKKELTKDVYSIMLGENENAHPKI